ncbi:MAG TPA: hypothetical protein VGS21_07195, partial [Acidimicrobiales bacterium]|nr:hypothetical protein [Acidimicrobiales bacterium]
MSGVLRVVEPGREARLALLAVIRAAQTDDPLAPVTIVTPSNVAALSLRRRIVPEASLVNVRFTRLQSLAEQLGGAVETARGRARLSPLAMAAAIRSALDREAGPLAAVREHPSTVRT